ncbi:MULTISPECIES: acylneuraminate cytidylyltransferase family protein [unclassified Pseudoalteromonas]|uniref:acylneuraminate cytidylyltransferase family protein n=1 Tax=unclassified Pseudoalteromonas TaxID=194690 RepID=UPI00235A1326|nr:MULTISPECIES: acylneuraminate cytidylyltransferase family protein [unclassified Pseudoalteromonas]MDC9565595.1 acylneuraminate cytidylyltransferase family protein [Pseudoalteromonas sp. GAB2316C]MDC9569900.1 acylneuraminate cytidylyltransferase family protein [Pseudoalteromonas sp. GABNB9D]MDC9574037.1 acylneuraminate cytidylyltransferase family protein [Pseudoalteromonas sp. GABNS16A]MDC9578143.1 acylneuraminate cytidylyltransferase family protein [Pseudoalteromonas sp. GABNS16E]MDC9584965
MITAFLPCRKGSQRIPDKNVKPFAGIEGGLLKIKLDQLLGCSSIDSILVSSNDDRVLEFVKKINDSRVIIDHRPEHLGNSSTTTDELIRYVASLVHEGDILWTHVTSPFMTEEDYSSIIRTYFEQLNHGYDSLMTVLKLQGFIWNKNNPVSYNRADLKWPMTQNIEPLYEIDSGAFLSSVDNYRQFNDRIATKPYLLEQDKLKSVDIDWPNDFILAELLWNSLGHK